MNAHDATRDKRVRFRKLLRRKRLTVMPGGFSPLYARLAQQAGFECFFLAGSQLSGFLYGVPDNGIIGLRELVDHARHMAMGSDIPILVDADTGFGNAVNVYYAVREIVQSGVAALQIEDQEAPKKSATSAGRRCISKAEAIGKIKAAVAARDECDPEFAICARVDSLGAEGGGFADALDRAIAYVKDGGADFIWLNSVESRADLSHACRQIPAPVLAIWGGSEAPPTLEEYAAMGLRIALYPTIAATSGLQAAWELLNDFHARGTEALMDWDRRTARQQWGRPDRKALVGFDRVETLEKTYIPRELQRDYAHTWGHRTSYVEAPAVAPAKPRAKARRR